MNTFKRKALSTVILGALGAAAGAAHAVYQDLRPGQALIYPYYSQDNLGKTSPFDTYLAVVNAGSAKTMKVRGLEGKRAVASEVLDFNLFLPGGLMGLATGRAQFQPYLNVAGTPNT